MTGFLSFWSRLALRATFSASCEAESVPKKCSDPSQATSPAGARGGRPAGDSGGLEETMGGTATSGSVAGRVFCLRDRISVTALIARAAPSNAHAIFAVSGYQNGLLLVCRPLSSDVAGINVLAGPTRRMYVVWARSRRASPVLSNPFSPVTRETAPFVPTPPARQFRNAARRSAIVALEAPLVFERQDAIMDTES